jgi:flavodoxin
MKILIVYDSYYGNTLEVAKTYKEVLSDYNAELVKVDVLTQEIIDQYDFIIIGAPTRAFNAPPKIRKAIRKLNYANKKIFVFDTRAKMESVDSKFLKCMVRTFGYAAEKMEKKLLRQKAIKILEYRYYYVKEVEGPLFDDVKEQINEDISEILKNLS